MTGPWAGQAAAAQQLLRRASRGNRRDRAGVLLMKTPLTMGSFIRRTPPAALVAGLYLALLAFALVAVSIRI